MMGDAHENHRNGARAGRHHRASATCARGWNYVAAHISCLTTSQLPAVLLGSARLAHRHLDAETAMSWYVYQTTNSKFLLGVVSAVGSAPMMISSIWGGALADRNARSS